MIFIFIEVISKFYSVLLILEEKKLWAQTHLYLLLSNLSKANILANLKGSGPTIEMILFHWLANLHIQIMTKST